jgi:hypothetical protein
MYGIQITTDGDIRVREYTNETALDVMQSVVGGYITMAPVSDRWFGKIEMLANDEGLLMGLPINPLATSLAMYPIVGDVFIHGVADDEGSPTPVHPEFIDLVADELNPTELERLSLAS